MFKKFGKPAIGAVNFFFGPTLQNSCKKLEKMLISSPFGKNCSASHSYLHNFFPFSAHSAIAYHWHHSNQIGKKIRSNHEISNPDCTKVILSTTG